MLEHTACAAVLVRNSARFQVRRWALRLERREAAPWGGATTGDGKTPWNVRPAGFPDLGSSSRGGAMEVGSGFSLQDTVRAQVGVSPAGQGVGGPGCAGGRSMGCGNRARPSLWAPGRGSGAGGGWALQTGVGGGNGARFCSHSWKHPRQLVAKPGLPADLTTTTWSVRRAKTDRYLFRLSRREPVWGEILVRSPLHPGAININLSAHSALNRPPRVTAALTGVQGDTPDAFRGTPDSL